MNSHSSTIPIPGCRAAHVNLFGLSACVIVT